MKPVSFDYFVPATLEEAVGLLQQHGDDAKILAGGQSLVPMMNFRLVRPKCLIDINSISSLSYIKEVDGTLRIGALTRHRALEYSPLVLGKHELLAEAVRFIGHPAIRTRGTIGGSISHADPTAELPTLLLLLDGSIEVIGPGGRRSVAARDLFVTYFTTTLEPGELCAEVVLPLPPPRAGWAYEEFYHRHGDFAIIGSAVIVETDSRNRCTQARVAIAGAAATPVRATAAEQFLKGQELSPATLAEAGRKAAEDLDPDSDLHASAAFRKHLVAVMTERALAKAIERQKAGGKK